MSPDGTLGADGRCTMVGRMLFAVTTFVVFGVAAVLMGRSSLADWREVRRGEVEPIWAGASIRGMAVAAVAAAIALVAPFVIVTCNGA